MTVAVVPDEATGQVVDGAATRAAALAGWTVQSVDTAAIGPESVEAWEAWGDRAYVITTLNTGRPSAGAVRLCAVVQHSHRAGNPLGLLLLVNRAAAHRLLAEPGIGFMARACWLDLDEPEANAEARARAKALADSVAASMAREGGQALPSAGAEALFRRALTAETAKRDAKS